MHSYSKLSGKKRLRFKDWLIERLDTAEILGVQWIDRDRGLFKIPWTHGSHKNWNRNDVEIFRQWAIYSGKHNPGDTRANPIKWKTNFRCTLNALPDFIEVRQESSSRGSKRYKIYSLKNNGKAKKKQKALGNEEKKTDTFDLTDTEIVQMVDEMMTPRPAITRSALQKPLLFSPPNARPNATYPAFETLVLGKSTETFPFSYTPWVLAAWNAMAVDLHVEKPEEENSAEESVDAKNDSSEEAAEYSE